VFVVKNPNHHIAGLYRGVARALLE
jgi:hypothetical protein